MALVFKVGDFIRVKNIHDPVYTFNNFYKILEANKTYVILSCQSNEEINMADLDKKAVEFGFENSTEFLEYHYRLVTPAELVLYGK